MQALRGGLTTLSSKTSSVIAPKPCNFKRVFGISYQSRPYIVTNGPYYNIRRRWRGKSSVASLPSDSPEPQRRRSGRVSRDERKAMVEAFVHKYRALNAGKYPSPSVTQKQVGGSYYVVKNILQELEYNSKRTTSKKDEISLEDLPGEEYLISAEATKFSSSKANINLTCTQISGTNDESQTIFISHMEKDVLSRNRFAAKEEVRCSTDQPSYEDIVNLKTTGDHSSFDETHIAQLNPESKAVSHLCKEVPEDLKNSRFTSDGSVHLNEQKLELETGQEAFKSELETGQEAFKSDKLEFDGKNKVAPSNDSVDLDKQNIVPNAVQEASYTNKLESKEVSDICIEDPENSKKAASVDFVEPRAFTEATKNAFESEKLESKKVSQLCTEDPESEKYKKVVSDDSLELNKTKVVLEAGEEASRSDNLERDVSRVEKQQNELLNKSTVWGNLRSFAEGVINFWRKM